MKNCGFTMAKTSAFTLAEVLITLSIIGIVAVLTISPVIMSYKEKATVVKPKKLYVELNSAFRLAEIKEGKVKYWGWSVSTEGGHVAILNKLIPYLNVSRNCGAEAGCWKSTTLKNLNGTTANEENMDSAAGAKALLTNGVSKFVFLQIFRIAAAEKRVRQKVITATVLWQQFAEVWLLR